MIERRRSNAPLLAGLVVSLVLHALVLLPALTEVMSAQSSPRVVRARFEPEVFRLPDEEEEPDELKLGIDEGAPSTLTWIGYEEYERHIAELAQVEQAAFREEPTGSEQPVAMVAPRPSEATEPVPPAEPEPPVDQAVAAALPEDQQGERPKDPARDLELALQPEPAERTAVPIQLEQLLVAHADTIIAALEDLLSQAREGPKPEDELAQGPQAEPARATDDQQTPQPAQPAPPKTASVEPQPPQPVTSPGSPDQGDQADKESDATSLEVSYEDLKAGKPLAARGLELKPQRPEFTVLLRVTAAPGNPLCEMHFDRTGKPLRATILRSSGHPRVDDVILASLYRWRASGAPLERLTGEQTIPVRMWIILNPRARTGSP